MQILMIGCGKMGGAMLQRWTADGEHQFTVVDPVADAVADDVKLFQNISQVPPTQFDLIVIAIKPQMIAEVLPEALPHISAQSVVVSIAAGFTIAALEAIVGNVGIVRVMPNLPAMIGKGVNGVYANARVNVAQKRAVDTLLAQTGMVLWLDDEDSIDRIITVSGSGPGFLFEFMRQWVAAAEQMGFDAQTALQLVAHTMIGSAELALASDDSLETLRNSVTSKNGTTEAGLREFMRDGVLQRLLTDTVQATYKRAVELR